MTRRPPAVLVLLLLLGALVASVALAAAHGQVRIAPGTVVGILLRRAGLPSPADWTPQEEMILLTVRLPRVAAAAVVGAALAAAGVLMQGLLRNPLADPYVVGTSGGAALGSAVGILLGSRFSALGFGPVPVLAFLGAVGAMALVVQLSSVGGRLPVVTVLLAGFAVSTLLGYTVPLLLVLDSRAQLEMPRIYARLLGGLDDVVGWSEIRVVAALVLAGVLAALALGRSLNAFSAGEDGAARLGIRVERDKRLIIAAASLLTGAAVSISGLIGFVGLVVPHVARLVCGPNHRLLIPASALGGASFLVLADLLARVLVPPSGLPVGIVTAFLGGPFFLWLLRRSRKEYQW